MRIAPYKNRWIKLLRQVADKTGYSYEAVDSIATTMFETIKDHLRENKKVVIIGLGTFGVKMTAPRERHDVHTHQFVYTRSRRKIFFKLSAKLDNEFRTGGKRGKSKVNSPQGDNGNGQAVCAGNAGNSEPKPGNEGTGQGTEIQ